MNAQASVKARETGSDSLTTSQETTTNLEYVPYSPDGHFLRARMDDNLVYLLERGNGEKRYEAGIRDGRLGSSRSESFSSFDEAYRHFADEIVGDEAAVEELLGEI